MKIIKYLATGLSIGFICTGFFMTLFIGLNGLTMQLIGWIIASCMLGLVSIIFENKKFSLIVTSIIHYILCLIIVLVMIFLFYREYIISVLISFTITYFITYLITFNIEKQSIKKINKHISSR